MRNDFDRDPTMPNPYEEVEYRKLFWSLPILPLTRSPDCTMAQLRLELLKEEVSQVSGMGDLPSHKVSAGAFFRKAIEIEDRL